MSQWVALFRGINVGGNNRLPMKPLAALLEGLGCTDVKTYIQSGNVVFQACISNPKCLLSKIQAAVDLEFGFEPAVLLLKAEAISAACNANPFPIGEAEPKTLHLFFMAEKPTEVNMEKLTALQSNAEQFALQDNVLYLHAPDGIARSKLAANVERCLGVPVTARNWRTVNKILELTSS